MAGDKDFMAMENEMTRCNCGSIPRQIFMERSHGVLNLKVQKPVLNANDYKYPENIKGYGKCSAGAKEIKAAVDANRPKADNRSCAGALQQAVPVDVSRTCVPILKQVWQDCAEHYTVEGAPVLLRKSYLVCDRGGIIKFVSEEKGDDNPLDLEETVGDSLNESLQNLENAVPNKGNFELKNENGDKVYMNWNLGTISAQGRNVDIGSGKVEKENSLKGNSSLEVGAVYGDIKASAGVSSTWGQMSESNPAGKDPECTGYMRLEKENMGMIGVKRDMIKKKTEIEKNFDGLKKMAGEETEKIADEYSGGMVTKTKEKIDSLKKEYGID